MTRRTTIAGLLILLLLAAVGPLVGAQTQEIDLTREEREQLRRERAAKAAELDPLLAQNDELEQAVADLNAHVATQEAKLDSIRQSLAAARAELSASRDRVAAMEQRIAELRAIAREQAVVAYVQPGGAIVEQMLEASDINEANRRRAMLRSVSSSQADVLDELRSADEDLKEARDLAAAAVEAVEEYQADETRQLAELEAARAEQLRLKEALELRIAEFQAEIDAMDEADAALTAQLQALIVEEEQRQRAAEEARRRAEEQARLAALTAPPATGSTAGPQATPQPLAPLPAPSSSGGAIWPVGGPVTSGFGPRWGRMHNGLDITAPTGTPIGAILGGTVIAAGDGGDGYGLKVVIDHGGGFASLYAHLSSISVGPGQSVSQGTGLGGVGCTGSCTGPHLHFETRVNGIAQDPFLYLP